MFVNCHFFLNRSDLDQFPLNPINGFFPIYKFPSINGKAEKIGELEIAVLMKESSVQEEVEKFEAKNDPGEMSLQSKKEELLRTMNEAKQFLLDQDIKKVSNKEDSKFYYENQYSSMDNIIAENESKNEEIEEKNNSKDFSYDKQEDTKLPKGILRIPFF